MRQRSKLTQEERLRKDQPLEIPRGEYVSLKEVNYFINLS